MISMDAPTPLRVGTRGVLRPKKGPTSKFVVTALIPDRLYEDTTLLPGARLVFRHEAAELDGRTRLSATVTVSGPTSYLWAALLRKEISGGLQRDLNTLVRLVETTTPAQSKEL